MQRARLLAQLGQRQRADELAEVADALARVALGRLAARPTLMNAPIRPITPPPPTPS